MKRLLLIACISTLLNATESYQYETMKFIITTIDSDKKQHTDDIVLTKEEINRIPLLNDLVNHLVNDLRTDAPIQVPYHPSITKENLNNLIKIIMLMPDELFITEDPNRLFMKEIEKNKVENELSNFKNAFQRDENKINQSIEKIERGYEEQKENVKSLYNQLQEARDNELHRTREFLTEESRLENVKMFNDRNSLEVVAVERKIEQAKQKQTLANERVKILAERYRKAKTELPEENEINNQILRLETLKKEAKNKTQGKESELKKLNLFIKNESLEKSDTSSDEKLKEKVNLIAKKHTPQDFLSTLQLVLLSNYLNLNLKFLDAIIDTLPEKKVSPEAIREIKQLKSPIDPKMVKKISNATIGVPHKILRTNPLINGKVTFNAKTVGGRVAFSPDGKFLVSMTKYDNLEIWNTKTWICERVLTGENLIVSISFSPDNTLLAIGRFNNTQAPFMVDIWNTKTWKLIKVLEIGSKSDECYTCFIQDKNSQYLITEDRKTITLWNTKNWKPIKKKYASGNTAFSDTGLMASAKHNKQRICEEISISNLLNNTAMGTLNGYPFGKESVNALSFNAHGSLLATGDIREQHIRIWDIKTGECIKLLPDIVESVNEQLAFSPNNQWFASECDTSTYPFHAIRVWNTNSWKCTQTIYDSGSSLRFSPDGESLAAATYGKYLKIWYFNIHLTLDQITDALYCKQNYKAINQDFKKDYIALPESVKDMLPKPLWVKNKVKFFEEKSPQKTILRKLKDEASTQKIKLLSQISASKQIKALKLKVKK